MQISEEGGRLERKDKDSVTMKTVEDRMSE